jgi:hypothetical protein
MQTTQQQTEGAVDVGSNRLLGQKRGKTFEQVQSALVNHGWYIDVKIHTPEMSEYSFTNRNKAGRVSVVRLYKERKQRVYWYLA